MEFEIYFLLNLLESQKADKISKYYKCTFDSVVQLNIRM